MSVLDLRLQPAPVPRDCLPCRFCNSKQDMYVESPVAGDWFGRGVVWRIGCACEVAMNNEPEETRTEFELPAEAVSAWNKLQEECVP